MGAALEFRCGTQLLKGFFLNDYFFGYYNYLSSLCKSSGSGLFGLFIWFFKLNFFFRAKN
jgi:hypothetical protein